jgi:hypothetical protein
MADDDVGALTLTRHRIERLGDTVPDPNMVVGYAEMPGHQRMRPRTRLRPMPHDTDRRDPLVHRLSYKAYLVPRLRQMRGQRGELTETAPVYESYMHAWLAPR